MGVVNPAINIAIGNYGKEYITSFYNYFIENEPYFKDYSAFYLCGINTEGVFFSKLDDKDNQHIIALEENIDRRALFELLNLEDCQFFFKNSISNAYTDLVNLINLLDTQINFKIININLIISSFEDNVSFLFNELVKQIEYLNNVGIISNVSVKTFVVLSKKQDLLNDSELIITHQNLEEIKTVQNNYDTVFHNTIFIDNLNTEAIFLKLNNNSIGFVLNEFITYLMTNHYKMIGNLPDSKYISLGLGTLFFDKKYFLNIVWISLICNKKNMSKDLMKELHEILARASLNIEKLSKSQKETSEQMKKTDEQMKKTDEKLERV